MKAASRIGLILVLWPATILVAAPQPEGTRLLVMVVQVASLDEIMSSGEDGMLGLLRANGITDDMLADGSAAAGIVYCCGGKVSKETRILFYVPPELRVAIGDVAEIATGRVPTKKQRKVGDRGTINRAIRVRESFEDEVGSCRWDPANETLWMRVLYCDWMLGEGWQYRGGLSKGWYKPPGP